MLKVKIREEAGVNMLCQEFTQFKHHLVQHSLNKDDIGVIQKAYDNLNFLTYLQMDFLAVEVDDDYRAKSLHLSIIHHR